MTSTSVSLVNVVQALAPWFCLLPPWFRLLAPWRHELQFLFSRKKGVAVETIEKAVVVRLLNDNDYDALLKLQKENVAVPNEERSGGFLSAEFTAEQLRVMHESAGIVVAFAGDTLAAYFCLSTFEVNKDAPIVVAMREAMRDAVLDQRALDSYSFVVAGPICIARPYRGTGLFERLYDFAAAHFGGRFELAVAFIARDNQRSVNAHVKVGMSPIAQFEYRGTSYELVARRL